MDYTCNMCKATLDGKELVKQTLAVTHCFEGYHAGPYAPVMEWATQTRPEINVVRRAVEK